MTGMNAENRETALLNLQIQTFYRVNRFISSIYILAHISHMAEYPSE